MSVTLPTRPAPWNANPTFLDFGITATPVLGGATQRISRLGSRWRVQLDYPAVTEQYAADFRSALIKARSTGTTIRARWPVAGIINPYGAPLVNGGSQTGSSLIVDGIVGQPRAGSFFSYEVSSKSYLSMLTDDATVASGAATLSIAPMLRVSPADNAVLNFGAPIIEGFLEGNEQSWTFDRIAWEGFSITITEAY